MECNTDRVTNEESQEEDDDSDDSNDSNDTMNQIESINLPVKRKAVLEEPSIHLCADDDCGLEIEGTDLLSCNAPGCNSTVCKHAHTIFQLVLTKTHFLLFSVPYDMQG